MLLKALLLLKPFSCEQFTSGCICTSLRRVHMPINGVNMCTVPRFDLNFNTRTSVFRVCSNSQPLCLSVLGDNNPKLPQVVCVCGGGGYFFGSDTNRAEQPQKVARGLNFGFRKKGNFAKMALISCAVTAHLICDLRKLQHFFSNDAIYTMIH